MPVRVLPLTFVIVFLPAVAVAGEGLNGLWARGDGVADVNVAPCGGAICMTNTAIRNSQANEKVGDELVVTASKMTPTSLSGSAFDPQRNRSYDIEMNVAGNRMTTRGCIAGGLLCKTIEWTRLR